MKPRTWLWVTAALVAVGLFSIPAFPVQTNAASENEFTAPVDTLACVSPDLVVDFNTYGISEEVLYGCGVFAKSDFSLIIPAGGIPAPSYDAWFSETTDSPGDMVAVYYVKFDGKRLYATPLPPDVAEHYLDPDIVGEKYTLTIGLPGGVAYELWDGVHNPLIMRQDPVVASL